MKKKIQIKCLLCHSDEYRGYIHVWIRTLNFRKKFKTLCSDLMTKCN